MRQFCSTNLAIIAETVARHLGLLIGFELNWYLRNAPAIQPYEKLGF